MANLKWAALMLLILIVNTSFLVLVFKTTLRADQGVSLSSTAIIVKDPFIFALKKYIEQKGLTSTGRVEIRLPPFDQQINVILSVDKKQETLSALPPQADVATTESSLSSSGMSIAHKNTIQHPDGIFKPGLTHSSDITPVPEVTILSGRVKRELTADSKMRFKKETTTPSVTARVIREASTTSSLKPMVGLLTPRGRAVREASTPFTHTISMAELTAPSDRVVREALISSTQTTPVQELSTPCGRVVREASTPPSHTPVEELSTPFGRAVREASTPPSHTPVEELSTPSGPAVREALIPPTHTTPTAELTVKGGRVVREALTSFSQTPPVDELSTPSGRAVREASTPSSYTPVEELSTTIGQSVREASTSSPHTPVEELSTPSGRAVREALTSSSQTPPVDELSTPSGRGVREASTPSSYTSVEEILTPSSRAVREASTSSSHTPVEELSTPSGQAVREALTSSSQTPPVEELSTPSGRAVREALTSSSHTSPMEELSTSSNRAAREALTSSSQTLLLQESTTAPVRVTRDAFITSGMNIEQKRTTTDISRVLRALSPPASQVTEEQERKNPTGSKISIEQETTIPSIDRVVRDARLPRGGDISELSNSDLNLRTKLETTIPPRIMRDVATPTQTSLFQEVTRPIDRVFRETLTQNRMNVKDEIIPSIRKKPYLKPKMFFEGFGSETLSGFIEGLEQVKLQGMKKNDDVPTFPPPTDPEGTDF